MEKRNVLFMEESASNGPSTPLPKCPLVLPKAWKQIGSSPPPRDNSRHSPLTYGFKSRADEPLTARHGP